MARLIPLLITVFLAAAAPAPAQVLTGATNDPAEHPGDPGRDVQSLSSTFDPAGTWQIAVRFYGAPTAETSALLRVYLGERDAQGGCATGNFPVMIAAYTDPADKGGKGFVEAASVDVAKTVDADLRGFSVTFTDSRLANRAACAITGATLSRKEPFDRVGGFDFPGAPAAPAEPGTGAPQADTAPPSAGLRILRDPRSAGRGIVRVSLVAATEPTTVRTTLYGPAGLIGRATAGLAPGQELRQALRLGRHLRRLERTGRLPVRVVTVLEDRAGNRTILRAKTTLRHRRR